MVYNYVRVRMADNSATEDVVAEAYLLAARSFSRFDPTRAKFSTWVVKIATNCMNGYYRKQRPSAPLEDVPETYFAQAGEQDQLADRDYVDRLFGCLDSTERELIAMKYMQGFRNVDIAEALDMNASTVSTMLARSLAKMRTVAETLETQNVSA